MHTPAALTACSDHDVELASEPCDSRDTGHRGTVQEDDHKCFVGEALPLAAYAVKGGTLEPKAGIVSGVAEHDHEGTSPVPETCDPRPDQLRTDTLSLLLRQDRHRCKPHSRNRTLSALDHNGAEEDVTRDAATGKGHERKQTGAVRPQSIDDVRLGWLAKGLLVDPPYCFPVFFKLFPDFNHDATFPTLQHCIPIYFTIAYSDRKLNAAAKDRNNRERMKRAGAIAIFPLKVLHRVRRKGYNAISCAFTKGPALVKITEESDTLKLGH